MSGLEEREPCEDQGAKEMKGSRSQGEESDIACRKSSQSRREVARGPADADIPSFDAPGRAALSCPT